MPERFSWVVDEMLAGMERPGLFHSLDSDLLFLSRKGIDVIINLEETGRHYPGFDVLHLPITDMKPPDLDVYEKFLSFAEKNLSENKRIVVHCYAGMGRTNLMIASYMVRFIGLKPGEALQDVQSKRPVFMVTDEQEESLWEYYLTL